MRAAHAAANEGKVSDPLVNIVVDAGTFARVMVDAGLADDAGVLDELMADPDLESVRCETANGLVLHPHHVLRAALAGHIRRVVVDSDGSSSIKVAGSDCSPVRHVRLHCCWSGTASIRAAISKPSGVRSITPTNGPTVVSPIKSMPERDVVATTERNIARSSGRNAPPTARPTPSDQTAPSCSPSVPTHRSSSPMTMSPGSTIRLKTSG